ncbi:MAG: hypothetical protein NTY53_26675 [Kiritimatiellaeota bacterium]|nr:hypothetical protein [Kiritimatiellota bacterium]
MLLILGNIFVVIGCTALKSPRAAGIETRNQIEDALQHRNYVVLGREMTRMDERIEKYNLKELGEFFSAWPNDSFKSWMNDVARRMVERKGELLREIEKLKTERDALNTK